MSQIDELLPRMLIAKPLSTQTRTLFIGAFGFEARSLAWLEMQAKNDARLPNLKALLFRYPHSKTTKAALRAPKLLRSLGATVINSVECDHTNPRTFEEEFDQKRLLDFTSNIDEVVVDISGMTKFLMLSLLIRLSEFSGRLRIVYAEAQSYGPTEQQFIKHRDDIKIIAGFPSIGASDVCSLPSLASVRMQGQPVSLIAFLSFNEQLIRHLIGSVSPHRLIAINGLPPRSQNVWREKGTRDIHQTLIDEYAHENPFESNGRLANTVSTLEFSQTVFMLESLYAKYGFADRIIVGATGSKMQTVGLAFFKLMRPDIHIDYPMPNSYYPQGFGSGLRELWEINIPSYRAFAAELGAWELGNP